MLFIITNTLISVLRYDKDTTVQIIGTSIRLIYIYLTLNILGINYFDVEYGKKIILVVSVVLSIYAFVQYVFAMRGVILSTYIPGLPIMTGTRELENIENWDRVEKLLDRYNVKPLIGVIPNCEDSSMDQYVLDDIYSIRLNNWVNKGWTIALHGYNHVYSSDSGGINPVNYRSEFAGESLEIQKEKIRSGLRILKNMV